MLNSLNPLKAIFFIKSISCFKIFSIEWSQPDDKWDSTTEGYEEKFLRGSLFWSDKKLITQLTHGTKIFQHDDAIPLLSIVEQVSPRDHSIDGSLWRGSAAVPAFRSWV